MRAAWLALALVACGGGGGAMGEMDLSVTTDLAVRTSDLGAGASCTFNRECIAEARCACDVKTGCFCEIGARGTGVNGSTTCTSSNDCTSSLCVEGPGAVSYCSDECETAAQCGGMLPRCLDVALLGRICARS